MRRGFPLSEVDHWDTGMLMNYCCEYDRFIRQQNGEVVHDDAQRYEQLKAMEPEMDRLYAEGKVKEHKYKEYKAVLRRCEDLLREE